MPAEDPPLVYWDADVFLSFIDALPDRIVELESLLDASRRGEIRIVTSTVTIVEVAFGAQEQVGGAVSEETRETHRRALDAGLADPAGGVSRAGRRASPRPGSPRPFGSAQPKPMDAIHLATARRLRVSDLHTYDERLQRWSGALGFPVREPIAREPRLPGA